MASQTMYKLCVICGLLCALQVYCNNDNNYGKFTLEVTDLETCKGPKHKDCCIITAKMANRVNLSYDITIKENVTPNRGKIVATANGKPLVRLQMKKPCDHLFLGPLFQTILNVTHDCVFIKGHYHFDLDIERIAHKYYGGMFLYGNITFKSIFYSDECNFSCTEITVRLSPRSEDSGQKEEKLKTV